MSRRSYAVLLLVFTFFSFYSCKKKHVTKTREFKVVSEIIKNDIDFKYFSSKAKVQFNNSDLNISSAVSLRMEKGTQIWASVMPALGIEMMRIKITRDSVFILNRLQKTYSILAFKDFSKQNNLGADFNTLEAIMMGDIPLKNLDSIKLSSDKSKIILSQRFQGVLVENIIDRKVERLTELNLSGPEGKINTKYSDFEDLEGQNFAKTVDIELSQEEANPMMVSVKHGRVKKSNEPLKFPFKIPDSYVQQ